MFKDVPPDWPPPAVVPPLPVLTVPLCVVAFFSSGAANCPEPLRRFSLRAALRFSVPFTFPSLVLPCSAT